MRKLLLVVFFVALSVDAQLAEVNQAVALGADRPTSEQLFARDANVVKELIGSLGKRMLEGTEKRPDSSFLDSYVNDTQVSQFIGQALNQLGAPSNTSEVQVMPTTLLQDPSYSIYNCSYTPASCPDQDEMNKQITRASWVFMFASISLFFGFTTLNHFIKNKIEINQQRGTTLNAIFMISGLAWFHGFALFVDWILKLPGPHNLPLVVPAAIKLVASFFFTLQPMTALMSGTGGIPFANFAGILLFHVGNLMSSWYMYLNAYDSTAPFSKANFPVYGMLCYTAATTLLTTANYIAYYPDVMEAAGAKLELLQVGGSFMLIVGSYFYLV